MRTISQRQLRNTISTVLNAVETGTTYRITRNGIEVAELRPLTRRQHPTAEELVATHRTLPRVSAAELKQEADEFFGESTPASRKSPEVR